MQVFKSKVDRWLAAILVLTMIVSLISVIGAFKSGSTSAYVSSLILLLLGVGLPTWLLLSTKYVVTDKDLIVMSGPFKRTIALSDIQSTAPSRNALASPALSLDRLKVSFGNGKFVLVSPKNKKEFIAALNLTT